MNVAFTPVGSTHYGEVFELATRIWNECYVDIITQQQIDYMLGMMYHAGKIAEEIAAGVVWEFIEANGARAGFTAYVRSGDEIVLNKIYFLADFRGQGLLPITLDHIATYARTTGARSIRLNVNKYNRRAIRGYEKNGFLIQSEAIIDIGGGYVMDDYILVRTV